MIIAPTGSLSLNMGTGGREMCELRRHERQSTALHLIFRPNASAGINGEAPGLRVTLMRNRGGILMPCVLAFSKDSPAQSPPAPT